MYDNNNQAVIKELAQENFRSHRSRHILAVLAIFLTTMLIAAALTVGLSLLYTSHNAGEQTPGPMSDGYFSGSRAQYAQIAQMEEIQWADFVQKCSRTALHNGEFGGIETRLFAPDDGFYRDNQVTLLAGGYPVRANDLLISDTLSQTLGQSGQVGETFTLDVVLTVNGEDVESRVPMRICGVYRNPLYAIASIYEEVYTAEAFIPAYNPEMAQAEQIIYVKLNNLNPLALNTDISAKMADIAEVVGVNFSPGKNSAQLESAWAAMLPVLVFVLLLMASGYFLIYNVFYISVVNDIRQSGLLKTLGATAAQLKKMLSWQVRRLAAVGIALGVAAGYVIGLILAPRVMAMTDWSLYYKAPSFGWMALCAAAFAGITVWFSAIKPLRIASHISPIEAQHFEPKGSKNIFTVLSLALSGVIFLAACNISLGYQPEVMVARHNQNDYQITHKAYLWNQEEAYEPIGLGLRQELQALPFVAQVDAIYSARTHDEPDSNGYYPVSMGEIAAEGPLYTYFQSLLQLEEALPGEGYYGVPRLNERGNLALAIVGLPPQRLRTGAVNYVVVEGQLDAAAFAAGDGVILNVHSAYGGDQEVQRPQVGDMLPITFYDKATGAYHKRSLQVQAVIQSAHEYSSSDMRNGDIIITDELFRQIYSDHERMISALEVTATAELDSQLAQMVRTVLQQSHHHQLITSSRYDSRISAENDHKTYSLIGFFLALVLAVIGISNVVNTVTAGVLAHKLEYAAMQSVGMTRRQLTRFIFGDCVRFVLIALALMLPLGVWVSRMMADNSLLTGFNASLFAASYLCAAVIMLALCALLAVALVKVLNRKSLVERLREVA